MITGIKRYALNLRNRYRQIKRAFEAAESNRFRKPPSIPGSGNTEIATAGPKLRSWARYLDENHDLSIGILDTLVNNIIGTGLTLQPMVRRKNGAMAVKINEQILDLWSDWTRAPEVTGTLSFPEVQRLACRSWLRDGEILAQHVEGSRSDYRYSTTVPYALEMIEADLLPFDLMDTKTDVVNGVELDSWGAPTAYYLYLSHPGEYNSYRSNQFKTKRVPATSILHLKFIRRFGQIRGQSVLHGVITRIDDVKEYEESERVAARVSAAFTGYIKKSADMSTGNYDDDGNRTFQMDPGMIFDNLLPGEDVGTIDANRPNPELNNFRNAMLRAIASGTGTSYSSISKDFNGTYSAQRQELVESMPAYRRMREQFISDFMRPVYERFIRMAVASGSLSAPNNLDLTSVDFGGVAMPWIDPKKEMEADAGAVANRFKSRHQIIRERGGDPRIVDEQIKQEQAELPLDEKPEDTPVFTKPEVVAG